MIQWIDELGTVVVVVDVFTYTQSTNTPHSNPIPTLLLISRSYLMVLKGSPISRNMRARRQRLPILQTACVIVAVNGLSTTTPFTSWKDSIRVMRR